MQSDLASDISASHNFRMGFDASIAFIGYGERWRTYKRISHQVMSATAVQMYYIIQEREAARLVKSIYQDPKDFRNQIRLWAYLINIYGVSRSDFQYLQVLWGG